MGVLQFLGLNVALVGGAELEKRPPKARMWGRSWSDSRHCSILSGQAAMVLGQRERPGALTTAPWALPRFPGQTAPPHHPLSELLTGVVHLGSAGQLRFPGQFKGSESKRATQQRAPAPQHPRKLS